MSGRNFVGFLETIRDMRPRRPEGEAAVKCILAFLKSGPRSVEQLRILTGIDGPALDDAAAMAVSAGLAVRSAEAGAETLRLSEFAKEALDFFSLC